MRRRPFRACLSLLLVIAMLSALPLSAVMAMPMLQQGDIQQAHTPHDTGHALHQAPSERAATHSQHKDGPPHCGGHCGLCGTCHSGLSANFLSSFIGVYLMPTMPRPSIAADVTITPDPRPPRG